MKALGVHLGRFFWCAVMMGFALGQSQAADSSTPIKSAQPLPPPPPVRITKGPLAVQPPVPAPPAVTLPPVRPAFVIPSPATPAAPRIISRPSNPSPSTPADALEFDSTIKETVVEPGEIRANFVFYVTNRSGVEVSINNVHTSCGCTVAKLPAQPWRIPPGQGGPIEVGVDLRGKRGQLTKSVTIQSSSGVKSLLIKVSVPEPRSGIVQQTPPGMLDQDRVQNIQKSLVDRQIVFKDKSCAECHADKTVGKTGKELYEVACAICHDAPHRATMVTDLKVKNPGLPEAWRQWIAYGRTNSLMPAFAQSQGGILSEEQIDSLVEYVVRNIPRTAQFSGPASVPTGMVAVVQPPAYRVPAQVAQPLRGPRAAVPMVSPPPSPPIPNPAATRISDFPFPE